MIESKHITKMVQHIVRRNRGVSDPQIMHPMRDWLIGIIVTILLSTVGSMSAAFIYHSYDSLRGAEIAAVATSTPYKVKIVEKALTEYREKRDNYNLLLGKGSGTVIASSTETVIVPQVIAPAATTTLVLPETVEFPEAVAPKTVSDDTATNTVPMVPDLAI